MGSCRKHCSSVQITIWFNNYHSKLNIASKIHSVSDKRVALQGTLFRLEPANKGRERCWYSSSARGAQLEHISKELFLTWLTLNEASDEKKMLFSPHSWDSIWFLSCSVCVCASVFSLSQWLLSELYSNTQCNFSFKKKNTVSIPLLSFHYKSVILFFYWSQLINQLLYSNNYY